MHLVMLKKSWPSNFGRCVRDPEGRVLERLEFAPGIPRELTDAQFEAVARDIEKKVLVEVELVGPKGKPVPVEELEAAAAAAEQPPAAPELRQDGPTLTEFLAAGYQALDYPPAGYAAKQLTKGEKKIMARARAEAAKNPDPAPAPEGDDAPAALQG